MMTTAARQAAQAGPRRTGAADARCAAHARSCKVQSCSSTMAHQCLRPSLWPCRTGEAKQAHLATRVDTSARRHRGAGGGGRGLRQPGHRRDPRRAVARARLEHAPRLVLARRRWQREGRPLLRREGQRRQARLAWGYIHRVCRDGRRRGGVKLGLCTQRKGAVREGGRCLPARAAGGGCSGVPAVWPEQGARGALHARTVGKRAPGADSLPRPSPRRASERN